MQGEHIRDQPPGVLFSERIIIGRKEAPIEGVSKLGDPGIVEVVKQTGFDTGPVMYGHRFSSSGKPSSPL
jgi:hypothetical protein